MPTVTDSVYSVEVVTDAGTIELFYSVTLGDMLIGALLAVTILYLIIRDVLRIVWRR